MLYFQMLKRIILPFYFNLLHIKFICKGNRKKKEEILIESYFYNLSMIIFK